ncbi:hypothetical protein M0D69_13795 [Caballeronia sp. SEWSISQ10-4 2]|uniref:hypothetical protein n=1 Tax=Caballeronia sp. SEWSISQ10-4 2 TaxID=2937438 RepID=UPI002651BE70|nr:hypothetical protein [Caballeronia sp. SEWSISQ10-4 2]MDN7179066.1 hypothetical protein [Caballeronia sp. SEWSISQ10-4 2]
MSKRYGRNQRRAHREQIERLASMYMEQQSINRRQLETIADFREHLQYVAATLGHMSILAGRELHHMDGHEGMQLVAEKPMTLPLDGLTQDERLCVEIMRLLDIKAVRDIAGRSIHAIVHLAGNDAAYAISEYTIRTLKPEQLKHLIERQVAPMLCALIAEQATRKIA